MLWHDVLSKTGHFFTSPQSWMPRDWWLPLNQAPSALCWPWIAFVAALLSWTDKVCVTIFFADVISLKFWCFSLFDVDFCATNIKISPADCIASVLLHTNQINYDPFPIVRFWFFFENLWHCFFSLTSAPWKLENQKSDKRSDLVGLVHLDRHQSNPIWDDWSSPLTLSTSPFLERWKRKLTSGTRRQNSRKEKTETFWRFFGSHFC